MIRLRCTPELATIMLVALLHGFVHAADDVSTLTLITIDAATGEPVPARVEIRDTQGGFHVAGDAVRFGGDCDMSDAGAGYTDLPKTLAAFTDRLQNPYTRSTQFYSDGSATVRLPAGRYTIAASKGPEYGVATRELEVGPGDNRHELRLERWIDMPSRGWYSADDHLHIPRPVPELNPLIMALMQAEDVHVANLLQMGKVKNFTIAPQYAHGEPGHYQEGNFILAAGQENPRTHFLGHTITLGADEPLHKPDKYLIYRLLWEESVAQGGINGFAHVFATGGPIAPQPGMAVVLPHDLLHFVEVVQFNRSGYDTWYDILGLGFRVAPTAGTDYPCMGQNIPGHERFYTRVEGELTYGKWIDAIRAGRTFATTGPILEFRVNGQDIGSEITLEGPGSVEIAGAVAFNPARDDVRVLELVQNGRVVEQFARVEERSRIEFRVSRDVSEGSWFAVRAYGAELFPMMVEPFHFAALTSTSNAHSGATYVTVQGAPGIAANSEAALLARSWLARLENLERVLAEANMDELARRLETPDFDAVPSSVLEDNRRALLAEIDDAKQYFRALTGD